jgi:hypothetical protein
MVEEVAVMSRDRRRLASSGQSPPGRRCAAARARMRTPLTAAHLS